MYRGNFIHDLETPPNFGGGFSFDLPRMETGGVLNFFSPATGKGGGLNLGKLVGDSIPFAGAIGGLLDGMLNFGRSPVGAFFADANKFKDVVLPRIKSQYANDLSKMFTEMSKATEYMMLHYTAHRSGSKSPHSIEGNQKGLDIISNIRKSLYATADSLKSDYTVKNKTIQNSFPRGFISDIGPFNGNHNGSYREYTISKKQSFFGATQNDATGVPIVKDKMSLLWLLAAVPVGLIVWLFTKKK